ncbi:TatD family hydrolase [Candidatus Dependentiae bacterium]|nr:TatD family hydrolase [Candidatus Dependentiae bacterium]MCC7414717.1 TatD family hydrolase [Campylobacterota bacterium]
MLIDTHCHINMMVKTAFDTMLTEVEVEHAQAIIHQAAERHVKTIINVGTSLPESLNCVALAKRYEPVFAAVGLHPNDCTATWHDDLRELEALVRNKEQNKIVAIGECGLDMHYPDYNLARQKDAFKAQIELALEHDLALIVHTRDAADETVRALEEYKGQLKRGVIHCFSEGIPFADFTLEMGFAFGIGGAITYPKNNQLRDVVKHVPLSSLILETDAPFLPPQVIRGKQNSPAQIATVAEYVAELLGVSVEQVSATTTKRAEQLFMLPR